MAMATWRVFPLIGAVLVLSEAASIAAQESPPGPSAKEAAPAAPPAPPPAPPAAGGEAPAKIQSGGFDSSYLSNAEPRQAENNEYITLILKDKDLADVLRYISHQVGVNIIADPEIKEKVSVELDHVEWRKALDVIARQTHSKIVEESERLIRFTQPPSISMEFQDAEIKVVLELLAKQAGANIVIAQNVKGKVSLSLREVPWQDALSTVVKTAGYATVMADSQNVEIIRVVDPKDLRDQLETRSFKLRYVRPKDRYQARISDVEKVADTINPGAGTAGAAEALASGKGGAGAAEEQEFTLFKALQKVVSKDGSLDYDENTNTFIVKETKPRLDEIDKIIKMVDIQPPSIFVEVKFISTKNNDFLEKGIKFSDPVTNEPGLFVSSYGASPDRTATDPLFRFGGTFPFDMGALHHIPQDFSALGILDFTKLNAVLRLVKTDENTRLLQEPTLTMVNNRPATIFVGDNVPFAVQKVQQDQNGNVTVSIDENKRSPIDVGFTLHLTPHWIPDTDMVDLTIIPKVSKLSGTTSKGNPGFNRFEFSQAGSATNAFIDLPQVASQTVVTYMRVQNGHTAVIGGLNTEQRVENMNRIPLLSSIPVLGNLFTWKQHSTDVNSLIILITPHLIKSTEQADRTFEEALEKNHKRDYFYNKYEKPGQKTEPKTEPAAVEK